jgi:hypothetical protein
VDKVYELLQALGELEVVAPMLSPGAIKVAKEARDYPNIGLLESGLLGAFAGGMPEIVTP